MSNSWKPKVTVRLAKECKVFQIGEIIILMVNVMFPLHEA